MLPPFRAGRYPTKTVRIESTGASIFISATLNPDEINNRSIINTLAKPFNAIDPSNPSNLGQPGKRGVPWDEPLNHSGKRPCRQLVDWYSCLLLSEFRTARRFDDDQGFEKPGNADVTFLGQPLRQLVNSDLPADATLAHRRFFVGRSHDIHSALFGCESPTHATEQSWMKLESVSLLSHFGPIGRRMILQVPDNEGWSG
jgi:hypothetical protein